MTLTRLTAPVAAFLIIGLGSGTAAAQNTSGVFSPTVDEGHRSMQYRAGFSPDTDGFAQRFHYQQSLDSQFRWRAILQTRKTDGSDFDFDYVRGELLWQLTNDDQAWQSGLRFDFRIRDADRPATGAVNWVNQFQLDNGWRARVIAIGSFDVGQNRREGIGLETRASFARPLGSRRTIGLEMFSSYGTTSDFADFDDQRHQLGPFVSSPLGQGWNLYAGALFGLTDATRDADLRLWISRGFQ